MKKEIFLPLIIFLQLLFFSGSIKNVKADYTSLAIDACSGKNESTGCSFIGEIPSVVPSSWLTRDGFCTKNPQTGALTCKSLNEGWGSEGSACDDNFNCFGLMCNPVTKKCYTPCEGRTKQIGEQCGNSIECCDGAECESGVCAKWISTGVCVKQCGDNEKVSPNTSSSGIVPCGLTGAYADRCTLCDLIVGIKKLFDYGIKIIAIIALACATFAGVMYVVSSGNESMMESAKAFLRASLIGLAVVLCAWVIVNTVITVLMPTQSDLGIGKKWSEFGNINCK